MRRAGSKGIGMHRSNGRFRAVAFDLDGTLIDTLPDLTAAVNVMLAGLGGAPLSQSQVASIVGEGVRKLVARAVTQSLGAPPPDDPQCVSALERFASAYDSRLFAD